MRAHAQKLSFLLSPGETRLRFSYDHSRISRRERDYILLLSCFETRSRLQKIISCGRARKNEADSRREFPGSRILADLWYLGRRSYVRADNMTQTDWELGCFLGWAGNRNFFGREQKSKLVLLDRKPIRHIFLVKTRPSVMEVSP